MIFQRSPLRAVRETTALKRSWVKSVLATLGSLWLGFYAVKIVGTEAIIRAGWHVQYDAAWVIALLFLRVLIYSVLIHTVRKKLAYHHFNSEDIKRATWMLVRILCVYECLFGLNLFTYLNDWVST